MWGEGGRLIVVEEVPAAPERRLHTVSGVTVDSCWLGVPVLWHTASFGRLFVH